MFLLWFFNCFYLCQVFEIAWLINRLVRLNESKGVLKVALMGK